MKQILLLFSILAAIHAQAQPLQPKPALMSRFSRGMLKVRQTPETREKLAILLQEPGKDLNLEQTLEQAGKDPKAFAAMLDATFRLNGSREAERMYLSNFVSPAEAEELTEYAMYQFTRKTTGGKINPRYPAGFTYGVKKFRDTTTMWYYIVTLTGNDIEMRLYGSEKNKSVRNHEKPQEVIRGQLKGNKVVTVSDPGGGDYYFMDGVLGVYSSNYNLFFEFYECTPEGEYMQSWPQPVFAGYTPADIEKAAGTYIAPTVIRLDSMTTTAARNPETVPTQETVTRPSFPGGEGALQSYLNRNIQYPTASRVQNFRRNLRVSFVITGEGKIKDVRVMDTAAEPEFQAEAIRLVSAMPDWKPAMRNGVPLSTTFILTVSFYSKN
ncbi:energy transducer TonB [Chitinophaga barathri]|uniref:TonB C-terminal domain-containing protein n=1 Tax=Chitinophaga barathri TaxID=1647451 RepID=A0A3N4MWI5_9BACT|nr:energy transducer TonB [Chitinophaga barathri]RPD39763.1 hypothetical protein EG028_19195 [Chitinophaga barathri]